MKGIEFILLVIGALAGAFLRYKIVSSPMLLGALPLNVLVVNIIGSFILGVFSIVSIFWIQNIQSLLQLDSVAHLQQCLHLLLKQAIYLITDYFILQQST